MININEDNLYFVGGAERSGTTMLQRVLAETEGFIPVVSESTFINAQLSLSKSKLENFDTKLVDYFISEDRLDKCYKQTANVFLKEIFELHGEKKLALKFPYMTKHFSLLRKWYPDSKYIVIFRDPRDVIVSMRRIGMNHLENNISSKLSRRCNDIRALADFYNSFYDDIFRFPDKDKNRTIFVKYESIVARENDEIEKINNFVGPNTNIALDKNPNIRHSFLKNHTAFHGEIDSRDVNASRVGGYEKELDEKEIGIIERRCDEINKVYSYW